MKTVKNQIMQFFANQFQVKERDNGDTFVCLGDSAPSWCQDVCREAHGGLMPDDWRYSWISLAADSLADIDSDNWEDETHEIADGLVDVYNGRLLSWLSSNLTRAEYVNDAVNQIMIPEPGCFELSPVLMAGQYEEISETIQTLVSEIESLADDVEPYAAGFNMCGYMPDSEPLSFCEFDDAKQYVIDELKEREETAETESEAENYCEAAENVNLENREFTVVVNGLAFWVAENPEWLNNL